MRAVEAAIADSQWLTKEKHLAREKLLLNKEKMEYRFNFALA